MFVRLFDAPGWSGRPVSRLPEAGFDSIDRTVGGGAQVAMVPYPVSSEYFVNQEVWRDYEFWNRSIERDVQLPEKTFLYTGETFEKIYPRFDPATGVSNISPASYALQANGESRFRIAGTVRALRSDVMLIETPKPWRLDWRTWGLYPDGWTKPDTTAEIRVYAVPGQRGARTRNLSLAFRAPEDVVERTVAVSSNLDRWQSVATPETVHGGLRVCVPEHGYTVVRVRADGSSPIPGDLRDIGLSAEARDGGVLVTEIALADEIGGRCRPGRPSEGP
jgi:hypothetical protein